MSDTYSTTPGGTGVQDRAAEVAGTAKEQASEVAQAATEQAKAVAADAKQQARQVLEDGRRQLREQAAEQTTKAAGSLRELGEQLQRMASGEDPGQGPAADVVRQLADATQRAASSLQSKGPEELLADARRFARQRPGLFVLGALGAGFVAGRALRAVDTSTIKDAVRNGIDGDGDGAGGGDELVSGAGTLGALQAGMPGTTPADLVDPPTATIPTSRPPRAEPLRADGA